MTAGLAEVMQAGTSAGRSYADVLRSRCAIVPLGFALVGGLTGASANAFPSELIDWTSADVIELARPISIGEHAALPMISGVLQAVESPARRQLDEIKNRSRLTWGQIADAMGVDARAVHLWRSGGGITAAHEERLGELTALIDSIDNGHPDDVRSELIAASPAGSLLERLRADESPRNLQAAARWRAEAIEAVVRNIAEWQNDGVVDEDFFFLLYLEPQQAEGFGAAAREFLGAPGALRRDWEALLDAHSAAVQQPGLAAVEADEAEGEVAGDDFGIAPLFSPADLGIPLGVGAIASRRPLHDAR